MKRKISVLVALLLCALLMGEAFAIALPVDPEETVVSAAPSGKPEVADFIGEPKAALDAYLAEFGATAPFGSVSVSTYTDENGETADVVSSFSFREGGISVFGYSVDGRHDHAVQETMEAQGWTCTRKDFEGGLRWFEFEKTEDGMQYVFEMDSCDSVITYVSLSRSPVEAEAAQE